jgi:uncharacterized membrane protein YkoI
MQIKKIYKQLISNPEFKSWKKENKSYYLTHFFKMFDKVNKNVWQIGFYDEKTDKITVFILEKDDLKISTEHEIFKKENHKVRELNLNKVKIDVEKALQIAINKQEKDYNNQDPTNLILILQNLDIGQLYNITFVTQSFNTLNIKIDADNGTILEHSLSSLVDLKAR